MFKDAEIFGFTPNVSLVFQEIVPNTKYAKRLNCGSKTREDDVEWGRYMFKRIAYCSCGCACNWGEAEVWQVGRNILKNCELQL